MTTAADYSPSLGHKRRAKPPTLAERLRTAQNKSTTERNTQVTLKQPPWEKESKQ